MGNSINARNDRLLLAATNDDLTDIIDRKRWPSLLGPKTFIDWVKASCRDLTLHLSAKQ